MCGTRYPRSSRTPTVMFIAMFAIPAAEDAQPGFASAAEMRLIMQVRLDERCVVLKLAIGIHSDFRTLDTTSGGIYNHAWIRQLLHHY